MGDHEVVVASRGKQDVQDLVSQSFGRWTVISGFIPVNKNDRKWLCQCTCGTERYVLERSLRYGESLSCGCLRNEMSEKATSRDLTGQAFGELTVIRKLEKSDKRKGVWWLCRCSCGLEYEVKGTLLVTGKRTHCSSSVHQKKYIFADITGLSFGKLTALYPSKRFDGVNSVIWRCRCECGNEVDVSYNNLKHGHQKSCGCQKKEHDKRLGSFLIHVDGTSVDILKSKKVPTDNTTGCKGVYFIRGKFVAKIVFQKKAYYLGTFDQYEDAVQARREAEEILFDEVVKHYERWKEFAEINPSWAEEHPFKVFVKQDENKRLLPEFSPNYVPNKQDINGA